MSDEEPEYRPRRARRQEPEAGDEPAQSTPAEGPEEGSTPEEGTAVSGSAPSAASDDEAVPKPLYRDESTQIRPSGSPGTSPPSAGGELSDETTILGRARERRRSQANRDPDATTLLPRTASGGRVRRTDDFGDDDIETDPKQERRRLIVMIGAVAVVAILGLVAGYAIIQTTSQPIAAPGPSASPGQSGSVGDPTAEPTDADPTALLTDALMLSTQTVAQVDRKRTWKVALTQRGSSPDSPQPACLAVDAVSGAPSPQQTVLRVLSSDGSDQPAALHRATAYRTPEEAAQAYAFAARTIGDCAMSGAWISEGHLVTGVGDQAVGVTIQVLDGDAQEFRTVVLARTGRIVDVVDVAKPDKAISAKRVVEVTGDIVDTQCRAAGGACSDEPEVSDGPPPLGGDQPGFLASGDLPPIGPELSRWAGTTPGEPDPNVLRGSGCETTDWSKVDAEERSHRTYLLSDSSSRFGLDQVVITAADDKAATELAEKVRDDWKSCGERQLTATVAGITDVKGAGARSTDVVGWTTAVTQKSDGATNAYRVGVATAGAKVVFVFLNPQQDLDLTTDQFDTITVRAGQRATQVN